MWKPSFCVFFWGGFGGGGFGGFGFWVGFGGVLGFWSWGKKIDRPLGGLPRETNSNTMCRQGPLKWLHFEGFASLLLEVVWGPEKISTFFWVLKGSQDKNHQVSGSPVFLEAFLLEGCLPLEWTQIALGSISTGRLRLGRPRLVYPGFSSPLLRVWWDRCLYDKWLAGKHARFLGSVRSTSSKRQPSPFPTVDMGENGNMTYSKRVPLDWQRQASQLTSQLTHPRSVPQVEITS